MIRNRLIPHATMASLGTLMVGLGTVMAGGYATPSVSQAPVPGPTAMSTPTPVATSTPTPTSTSSSSVTTMDINATVINACTVATAAINFGNVDLTLAGQQDATGTLNVTCTSGANWAAAADAGGASGSTLTSRKMRTSGGSAVTYHLYTDANRATEWGDGTLGTAAVSGVGTGAVDGRLIFGRIYRGQTAPAGSYADRVTVTVSY